MADSDPPRPTDGRRRRRIGELLLAAGVVTETAIRDAIDVAAPGERLGSALVRLGLVGQREVADALAAQLRLARTDLDGPDVAEPTAAARIPMALAERHDVLPLRIEGGTLYLAMSDPSDVAALDDVRLTADVRTVRPVVATSDDLRQARRRIYREPRTQDLLWRREQDDGDPELRVDGDGADAAPVVARLDQLLRDAVQQRASDVHIEPYRGGGACAPPGRWRPARGGAPPG
ncbi:MAG: hypothetical protein WD638_11125 [Nitriliruptoraceae bacterium]